MIDRLGTGVLPAPREAFPLGPSEAEPPMELPAEPTLPPPSTEAEAGLIAAATSEPPPSPEPVSSASPVHPAAPPHVEVTIRAWFIDTFANLVATGRIREREVEMYLQDLLHRLHL